MALSMTGCGEGIVTDGSDTCRVEVRGVNNRHLKLVLRGRDAIVSLEPRVEACVRRHVRRGTVQVSVDLAGPAAAATRRLDATQLDAYLDDLADFCGTHGLPAPTSADSLLALPGVVVDRPADAVAVERAWPLVERALEAALAGYERMRRSEGATLAADMRAICGEIAALAAGVAARVPDVVVAHRDRLRERVARLLGDGAAVSEADVAREVALLADRTDVAEELLRLTSHVTQFDRLLDEDSPGRALDFLAQELAREANTIASKSLDVSIAHTVVEIKTRVERLREQAQNLE